MRIIFLLFMLFFCKDVVAQKQNNNWCFGRNVGVSFNTATPTFFTPTLYSLEGVATVSHRNTGTLLFYANTLNVYNSNFGIMPNGAGVGTNVATSCAQGVQIVPFVNDTNKYYVFTLSPFGSEGRLSYSVVDMTLDAGMGDVVTGQKHISIDTGFSEAMAIIEGCNSYWVLAYKKASADFYAYHITASGINTTPVISGVGYTHRTRGIAAMKVSPDRTKIGLAARLGTPNSFVALHDLNSLTGQVSNGRLIQQSSSEEYYGIEFSPNSSLLYVSTLGVNGSSVFQYNVSLGSTSAIIASKKTVHVSTATGQLGALQMAPDSNIYVSTAGNAGLGRISNANGIVPNCVYTTNAIPVSAPKQARFGLPQAVVHHVTAKEDTRRRDTTVCLEQPLVLYGRPNATSYQWQDNSTLDSFIVTQPGTYWVRMLGYCGVMVDTIVVHEQLTVTTKVSDTSICSDGSLTLTPAQQPLGATYKWSTGSTDKNIVITDAGIYWVEVKKQCNVVVDTIKVEAIDVKVLIANEDTTICPGDTVLLQGSVLPVHASYNWSTGASTLSTFASEQGRYTLTANLKNCTASDEVSINYYPRISIELGESREICNDEVITLPSLVTSGETDDYLWQDGSKGRTFKVSQAGVYYVTLSNQCQTISDTITITTRNCHLFFPSAFSPNGDGRNDIAKFVGDVANVKEYKLRIFNRWGEMVFQSTDVNEGWDGYYKGHEAMLGSYYYFIKYTYLGAEQLMKGDIILVR